MFIESVRLPADIPDGWPFTMEPVRQLATQGLTFTRPVTFLVGENGSGKSTLVEALADAAKINSEGGKAGTRYASTGELTPLGSALTADLTAAGLRLLRGPRRARAGFFMRAETLFNLARNVAGRKPASTCSMSQKQRSPSFPACAWSTSSTNSAGQGRKSSARLTPRSSPQPPTPKSSSSDRTAFGALPGTTSRSSTTGAATWPTRTRTCATSSLRPEAQRQRVTDLLAGVPTDLSRWPVNQS